MVLQLWADVKYHVPTGIGFSPKASGFYPFGDATALPSEGGGIVKRLFFMFLFLCPQYLSSELDLASLEGDGLEFLVVAVFAHEGLE